MHGQQNIKFSKYSLKKNRGLITANHNPSFFVELQLLALVMFGAKLRIIVKFRTLHLKSLEKRHRDPFDGLCGALT